MHQSKHRVLIVDDEPAICHSVRMILICAGYEVNTAWSSKEALALLENERHDVVVTDFNMPGMKGDELSEAIKARWPETLVVMLTGSAAQLRSAAVPLPSVDALLAKPFGIPELGPTLKQLLVSRENLESTAVPAESAAAA